jgi:hypothetical protein
VSFRCAARPIGRAAAAAKFYHAPFRYAHPAPTTHGPDPIRPAGNRLDDGGIVSERDRADQLADRIDETNGARIKQLTMEHSDRREDSTGKRAHMLRRGSAAELTSSPWPYRPRKPLPWCRIPAPEDFG